VANVTFIFGTSLNAKPKEQKVGGHSILYSHHLQFSGCVLTHWEPGYDILVLWNRPKTSSCQLPYQRPSSSADCARELFKGSNKLASLPDQCSSTFFVTVHPQKMFWRTHAPYLL